MAIPRYATLRAIKNSKLIFSFLSPSSCDATDDGEGGRPRPTRKLATGHGGACETLIRARMAKLTTKPVEALLLKTENFD